MSLNHITIGIIISAILLITWLAIIAWKNVTKIQNIIKDIKQELEEPEIKKQRKALNSEINQHLNHATSKNDIRVENRQKNS